MCALGGRPKEEGGHVRKDVTISKKTLKIMEEIKKKYGDLNFSKFIEELIRLYPELEEMAKEQLDFALEVVLDMLKEFGKF